MGKHRQRPQWEKSVTETKEPPKEINWQHNEETQWDEEKEGVLQWKGGEKRKIPELRWAGRKEERAGRDTKHQEDEDVGGSTAETFNQTRKNNKTNPHLSARSHLHEEVRGHVFIPKHQHRRKLVETAGSEEVRWK